MRAEWFREKQAAQEELTKLKTANQQKIEEYRKNSEAQYETLHKQLQTSTKSFFAIKPKRLKKEKGMEGL